MKERELGAVDGCAKESRDRVVGAVDGDSVVGGSGFKVVVSQRLDVCAGVVDDPVRLFVCEASEAEQSKVFYCES